ncbi:MAG: EpsI family protein [Fimbriimonadales bacterium]|nr:EpsI family protein [Fimbriimonadales bacterium]
MEEMKTKLQEHSTDSSVRATDGADSELVQGSDTAVQAPANGAPELEVVEGGAAPTDGAAATSAAEVLPIPAPPMDWRRFGAPVFVLMLLSVGLVLATVFLPRPAPLAADKTLEKIERQLGEWTLLDEYPMSEAALNELKPDEYIARVYVGPNGDQADLSIIAGSHTGAFHNPQVCFRVQNWEFADNQEIELYVPGKQEPIPARFVRLVSLEEQKREAVGIYFYSTPLGYRSDTSSARIFLLLARLTGMDQQRAYFVRFLKVARGDPERDREDIKRFAEQALASMARTNPEVVR